jgi:hypothetical protein
MAGLLSVVCELPWAVVAEGFEHLLEGFLALRSVGEREEHLVELGRAQRDVLQGNPTKLEWAQDVVESGDAFYAPAGHTSWKADAGTELLQISPSKELAEVEAAINEVMKGMQGPA